LTEYEDGALKGLRKREGWREREILRWKYTEKKTLHSTSYGYSYSA
jgi:hypothetical protein